MKVHEMDKDEARFYKIWNDAQRQRNVTKIEAFHQGWKMAQKNESLKGTAYPEFCREPTLCKGKGYCPRDPTCID